MFKPPKNPKIEELTKSHRGRTFRLSDLKHLRLNGVDKNCLWCLTVLKGNRQKWCSEFCIRNALAWARPQSFFGLRFLLKRQNFLCLHCGFSYHSYFYQALKEVVLLSRFVRPRMKSKRVEIFMKRFRKLIPPNMRPEIDHIIPVSLDGISIGLSNHQMLCRPCHKKKTKIDIKNRIKIKGSPLKGRKFNKSHTDNLSKARRGFDSENRKNGRIKNLYPKLRKKIIAINLTTREEFLFDSSTAAANTLNLQLANVCKVLKKRDNRMQHKGWTFKYQ